VGWTVELTEYVDPTTTYTTTTSANGLFSLSGRRRGTYTLSQGPYSPGSTRPNPPPGTYTLTVTSGQTVKPAKDFGDYRRRRSAAMCSTTSNGDGTLEQRRAGPERWTVNLLNSSNTTVDTATTGTGGTYSFTGLLPGTYTVQVVSQSGYVASSAASVTLNDDNGHADTVNFGEFRAGHGRRRGV